MPCAGPSPSGGQPWYREISPYPPSIFGMKKTSAPGGTGWK
jgi:hypothetical protein